MYYFSNCCSQEKSTKQYALTANAVLKYSIQPYMWRTDKEKSPALYSSSFSKSGGGFYR